MVEYLLDFDDGSGEETVGVDAADALHGETALTAACLHGNQAVVKLLLQKGASPEQTNARGLPPFLCAAKVREELTCSVMRYNGSKNNNSLNNSNNNRCNCYH